MFPSVGEVFSSVVDGVVGANRSDKVCLRRAAYAGNFRSQRPGDLHRKRPHASCRADNQHFLPRLDLSHIAKALEGGVRGVRNAHVRESSQRLLTGSHPLEAVPLVYPRRKDFGAPWPHDGPHGLEVRHLVEQVAQGILENFFR